MPTTAVSDTTPTAAAVRKGANPIRGLSHAAIRVRDIGATRTFYEGLLELPLTYARVGQLKSPRGDQCDFIHAFFEMGNGYVAFFEVADEKSEPFQQSGDNVETHFAMRVSSMEELRRFEQKLKKAGWPCSTIDHSWCFSLYFNDPDDWPLEIAFHYDYADESLDQSAGARVSLADWLSARGRDPQKTAAE